MLLTLRTPDLAPVGFSCPTERGRGVRTVELPGARAHLFHPAADTTAVLLEPDPLRFPFPSPAAYAAGGLLGMAIGRLIGPGTADGSEGPCAVEARVSVLWCPGGEAVLSRAFGPLGYAVDAVRLPLDPEEPRAGGSALFGLALSGRQRPVDVLSHLRVLLPAFDEGWQQQAGNDDPARLWEEGRRWLETHPEHEVLERILFRRTFRPGLHDQRHDEVLAALVESGAQRVLDLGCGTGALLRRLLEEPRFEEVVGVEVARDALAEAEARLPPGSRGRVLHGSLAYRDARLAGFDAAAVVEVVEHLDPPQLAAFETVVWEAARPATVVVTTPNAEYNTLFEYHQGGRLRHPDHRFEWTRAEFRAWAEGVTARHGYGVRFRPVGPEDARVGPLTQMAIFERLHDGPAGAAPALGEDAVIRLEEVAGPRTISTRLGGGICLAAAEAAAALEEMSRFAVDPRWLVYLPPSVPAAHAAPGTDTLEDPRTALAYYRDRGVAGVVLQELHPGTRVAAVVCRDADAARRRFRAVAGETGAVYSVGGRPFFATRAAEEAFMSRLRGALTAGGVWGELATEWVALEGVIGPGVPLMREVDPRLHLPPARYLAVAAAARGTLAAAEAALAGAATEDEDTAELLARTRERAARVAAYAVACRRAVRPARAPQELRFAPVRLLAGERGVYAEQDPRWHLERLASACRTAPQTLRGTGQVVVELDGANGEAEGVAWWEAAMARGSAGAVIRPLGTAPDAGDLLLAPALKCRSDAALRLVHGPEHTLPGNRERLRGRGGGEEAARAAREWALSVEALDRFVRGESPARVHECVFGALAVRCGSRPRG